MAHAPAHKVSRTLHPHDRRPLSLHAEAPNTMHPALSPLAGAPIAGVPKPPTSVPAPHLPTPMPVPEAPPGVASGPAGY